MSHSTYIDKVMHFQMKTKFSSDLIRQTAACSFDIASSVSFQSFESFSLQKKNPFPSSPIPTLLHQLFFSSRGQNGLLCRGDTCLHPSVRESKGCLSLSLSLTQKRSHRLEQHVKSKGGPCQEIWVTVHMLYLNLCPSIYVHM